MHTRRGRGSAALIVSRGAGGGRAVVHVRGGLGHQTSASATAVTKATYRGGAVDVGGVCE